MWSCHPVVQYGDVEDAILRRTSSVGLGLRLVVKWMGYGGRLTIGAGTT